MTQKNIGLNALTASSKHHDPALNALFTSSAGLVSRPPKTHHDARTTKIPSLKRQCQPAKACQGNEKDVYGREGREDVSGSSSDGALEEDQNKDMVGLDSCRSAKPMSESSATTTLALEASHPRKRKRKIDSGDLEHRYLSKLIQEDEKEEPELKKTKTRGDKGDYSRSKGKRSSDQSSSLAAEEPLLVHESLATKTGVADVEKASRTVFLANVSTEAVTSKSSKKTLLAHLATVLDASVIPPQKVESIRFRSLAFSSSSLPKRAAYVTGALMDATTRSSNAYVVYSEAAAARKAVENLNGTEVLSRHLRVDSVAHPSQTDHRRCVFVGNLGFVDDETVLGQGADGETKSRKRNKVPADVEEGLWRAFGAAGRKVENVRVVRDSQTRVGKGIAYVQFYDGNDVESALLLNGKKFPPMLPRPLRVTRAKAPHKTALAMERARAKTNTSASGSASKYGKTGLKSTHEQRSMSGRAEALFGRSAVLPGKRRAGHSSRHTPEGIGPSGFKSPENVVIEGKRASVHDGLLKSTKAGRKPSSKGKKLPKSPRRSDRRAEEWRKSRMSE